MNFDITSEVGKLYDLSRTIPGTTTFAIAASGIVLLCCALALVFFTRRKIGLRILPVLYGISAYLLFYIFIGSFLSGLVSMMLTEDTPRNVLAIVRFISLILSTASLVLGRFCAMWFIRRYFPEYCDAWGIGVGVSLSEGAITGATIFFNYCLCLTINQSGLASLAESCETVEEAITQLKTVEVFFANPSWFYLLSGLESVMYLGFHAMISVLYYAVFHDDLKKGYIGVILGFNVLLSLPGSFYSSGLFFNRIGCFLTEAAVFAGSIYFFLYMHKKFYKDIPPFVSPKSKGPWRGAGAGPSSKNAPQKKMPDFNRNINKL